MTNLQKTEKQLTRLTTMYKLQLALIFLTGGVAITAMMYTVFVTLDMIFHLPLLVCWLAWLGVAATISVTVIILVCTGRRKIALNSMALRIERLLPQARNRLINAIQLADQSKGGQLIAEKLLADNEIPLAQIKARDLTARTRLHQASVLLLLAVAGICTAHLLAPAQALQAGRRLLFPMARFQPYTETRIENINPGDTIVPRGQQLTITTQVSGAIPKHVIMQWQSSSGTQTPIHLEPLDTFSSTDGRTKSYNGKSREILYQSKYRLTAGDDRSKWFSVGVTNPPGITNWKSIVHPPEYLGQAAFHLSMGDTDFEIPAGSEIRLTARASTPLKQVAVHRNNKPAARLKFKAPESNDPFNIKFNVGNGGRIQLQMTSSKGLKAGHTLPFVVVLDQPPSVQLTGDDKNFDLNSNSKVSVAALLRDDHGLTKAGIERLATGDDAVSRIIHVKTFSDQPRETQCRLVITDEALELKPGESAHCRFWAEDNAPENSRHKSYSEIFTIRNPSPQQRQNTNNKATARINNALAELIRMQRGNLHTTQVLADRATARKSVSSTRLDKVIRQQTGIRDLTAETMQDSESTEGIRDILADLIEHALLDAITVLEKAAADSGPGQNKNLTMAVQLETEILAALTGLPHFLKTEMQHRRIVDLLARLEKLVRDQAANLSQTRETPRGKKLGQLARSEQIIARNYLAFQDHCRIMLKKQATDDLIRRVRRISELFEAQQAYENIIIATDALSTHRKREAVSRQETVLQTFIDGLNILNNWRVSNARKKLVALARSLDHLREGLHTIEGRQARIAEVTRDLAARGKMDEQVREELGKMDAEQTKLADMVEELAQDLYQFPEMPVSNELNSKMHEIYEAIEQAADSENAAAIEIAVQKEDTVLEAIRKTKERVEDIEMWLEDVPDNIAWKMESFDTDEIPDLPLVPLPEDLEDMVGELLEQAESINARAQDSTGNKVMADGEMGWGVADCPIPNLSAKGKSGNTRPNDNEMTGRSGAGREGQSSGELVEDHVKGLEGRETAARRTRDPLQKGVVTEDENSTLDARGTGGGKLGGHSESQGMFGNAPRRDPRVPDHAAQTKLRRETEALYATARLLYLGTGQLNRAARSMRHLQRQDIPDMQSFNSLHKKVMKSLENARVEIGNGIVLPMPVNTVTETAGAASHDIDVSKINPEYCGIVSDYYKGLDNDRTE